MKKILVYSVLITMVMLIGFSYLKETKPTLTKTWYQDAQYSAQRKSGKIKSPKQKPGEWFYLQRAYPYDKIPDNAYVDAYQAVKSFNSKAKSSAFASGSSLVNDPWVPAGPTNIPGRIPCIAVDPTDSATIYAGSAAGGVFKTTDLGATWTPIFDEVVSLSIGAIAIHPTNPDIIYVGTGEANAAGDTYEGVGMFKSIDAGATWTSIGLPQSYKIGRILIDPLRPDSVYVAVLGKMFGTNFERGLYRSPDGGDSWDHLLAIDDTTGCIDVVIDSATGDIFAAMWTRFRGRQYRTVGGINSGIYKSADGGSTWNQLLVGLPAPADTVGRIGLALDQTSGTLMAIYANHPGNFMGIYKSMDLGATWTTSTTRADIGDIYNGFGWYFGQIRISAHYPIYVLALAVELFQSWDGGTSWETLGYGIHADHHDIYIDPYNISNIYNATDGGVGYTSTLGSSWTSLNSMPSTQFYAISIDPSNSDLIYGGTQDNGSMRATSTAVDTWEKIGGGDGFYTAVDPTDPSIIYAEYQWGQMYKISSEGSYWATDWNFYDQDRHNWNTPFVMDPQNNLKLYYGSNKFYQTLDGGDTWLQKSDDLTNGPGVGNLTYGTLTTIAVAPSDSTVIYVGTDDGNVWVTQNADSTDAFTWTNVAQTSPTFRLLPDRWVTRVRVDPFNPAVAYVTLSGYKGDDLTPHIYRTDNYGTSWSSISGNLPDFPINDIIVDPIDVNTLYIGTDFGAFYTMDLGVSWNPLGTDMPMVPIHALAFHAGDRKLVAGTHGRSMYSLDLSTPSCCVGIRGNVDGDIDDQIDISDLVFLVAFMFQSGDTPPCIDEADIDGSGGIDISDLVGLVAYMFSGGDAPADCP